MIKNRRLPEDGGMLGEIYGSHYRFFIDQLPPSELGTVLELGSGHGFLKRLLPGAVTSELWPVPNVDLLCSAVDLPFEDESLSAIIMLDVLHHVRFPERFFAEAQRCLVPCGKILMVEPANTAMSRLIYRHLHHEAFEVGASDWQLPEGDPTLIANQALPWIIFFRDRARFEHQYPNLQVEKLEHCVPFSYLLSGGLSKPQLLPDSLYPVLARLEAKLPAWLLRTTAMFYRICVAKQPLPAR
ncbi:MAG: class I SAM-dependent methyltransferase [Pseudomonadales bacterium]